MLYAMFLSMLIDSDIRTDAATSAIDDTGLRGTWEVCRIEKRGMVLESSHIQKRFVFDGSRVSWGKKGTYKIRPGLAIKQIDITPLDGPDKGKTYLGIYEFEGDLLRICVSDGDLSERPTSFTFDFGLTNLRVNVQSFVLRRAKPKRYTLG